MPERTGRRDGMAMRRSHHFRCEARPVPGRAGWAANMPGPQRRRSGQVESQDGSGPKGGCEPGRAEDRSGPGPERGSTGPERSPTSPPVPNWRERAHSPRRRHIRLAVGLPLASGAPPSVRRVNVQWVAPALIRTGTTHSPCLEAGAAPHRQLSPSDALHATPHSPSVIGEHVHTLIRISRRLPPSAPLARRVPRIGRSPHPQGTPPPTPRSVHDGHSASRHSCPSPCLGVYGFAALSAPTLRCRAREGRPLAALSDAGAPHITPHDKALAVPSPPPLGSSCRALHRRRTAHNA